MIPTIQIKDNFLQKDEEKIIISNINKIEYREISNDNGSFGFRHTFQPTLKNKWLFKKIKKQFFPNVKLKILNTSYHWRHNKHKVMAHTDTKDDFNFILYLRGKELVHNGTGFYHQNNLNTYIGFVENRAIFFDGKNNLHTDLQALGQSSGRHTLNIFYKYG
jgi:hypothetical protein